MTAANLKIYAQLKEQKKEIDKQLDGLNLSIVLEMAKEGLDKQPTDFGVFALVPKKNWTYSDTTEELRTQLKEQEKAEQADGTATFEETRYLLFKPTPVAGQEE